jgi:voltage-gated sodium channel
MFDEYFGRMDRTLFTLFQIMTLDNWAEITRDLMVEYPWAWLPIIVYVIITAFVVVNLVIAVICDAVAALHEDEKAKLHGQAVQETTEDNEQVVVATDVRKQLTALKQHVNELTQMQDQTLQTVFALTEQLAQANTRLLASTQGATSCSECSS